MSSNEPRDRPGFFAKLKSKLFKNHPSSRSRSNNYPGNEGASTRFGTPSPAVSSTPGDSASRQLANTTSPHLASDSPPNPPNTTRNTPTPADFSASANEQQRIAISLLQEIDFYERLQNRVFLFRLLPPLRFRVTLVRNVNGRPHQIETVMSMEELRGQLMRILNSHAHNQTAPHIHMAAEYPPGYMTYEDLLNFRPRPQGVQNIDRLPTYIYHGEHLPEDKSTCPICLSNYREGEEIRIIPCIHFYHKSCIDEWLRVSKVCPVCKVPIEE
jgi:hypothetical protein